MSHNFHKVNQRSITGGQDRPANFKWQNYTACTSVHWVCPWRPWKPEDGIRFPRTGVINGFELSCGCRELNLDPVVVKPVSLTTEPSFQLLFPSVQCFSIAMVHSGWTLKSVVILPQPLNVRTTGLILHVLKNTKVGRLEAVRSRVQGQTRLKSQNNLKLHTHTGVGGKERII